MSTITEEIPSFSTTPLLTQPATFSADTDQYHLDLIPFVNSLNIFSQQANSTASYINGIKDDLDSTRNDIDIIYEDMQSNYVDVNLTYNSATIDEKILVNTDSQFAQYGIVANDNTNEFRPQDFFKEENIADAVFLADNVFNDYKVRFTDGLHPFGSQAWDLTNHKAPFSTADDELIATGTTCSVGHSKSDFVIIGDTDIAYMAISATPGTDLVNTSDWKVVPYVTKQVALLIEKTSAGAILNTVKPLVNMYGEESVETYEADVFSELGMSQVSDRVYAKDGSEFVLVGLKGFLNAGAYHPWFNEFGTRQFKSTDSDYSATWHESGASWVDGKYKCFGVLRSSGDNQEGLRDITGYINATAGSGHPSYVHADRPDTGGYYDKTYIEGQGGLICYAIPNAKTPTYKHQEEVKRNLVDGYIENGVETYASFDVVETNSTASSQNLTITTELRSVLEVGDEIIYTVASGVKLVGTILSLHTGYIKLTEDVSRTNGEVYISITVTKKSPYLATMGTTTTTVEVLADPTYYTDDMKSLLASGDSIGLVANLVDDGGNSNLPGTDIGAGVLKTEFKLNKKVTDQLQVLASQDSGATWHKDGDTAFTTNWGAVTFDSVANTVTFGSAPAVDDLIIVSSATSNQSAIKAITDKTVQAIDNFAIATTSHDTDNYNGLMNTVSSTIQTGTDTNTFSVITKIDNDVFSFTDDTTVRPTAIPFVADGYVGVFGSEDNVIDKSNQYIKASSVKV